MRKFSALFLSTTILSAFVLFVTSCDDDEPAVPPQLSFAVTELTAKESDDNLMIELVLDKPAPERITIEYSLAGTAVDDASTSAPADYEVVGELGEIDILEGETSASIELDLFSDTDLEDDETIEITIEEVSTDKIEITRDDEINITVTQEDGLFVVLQWGIGEGENYPDVDMDLFLWAENTSAVLGLTNYRGLSGSTYTNWIGGNNPEYFFLPSAAFDDGSYGLSCTYYEGTITPMNFVVSYVEVVNGAESSTTEKQGTYTLANINKWDEEGAPDPLLVAKFKKAGADYTDFEDITVPAASSRIGNAIDLGDIPQRQYGGFQMSNRAKMLLTNRLRK